MGWAKCLEIRSSASAGLYELRKTGRDYYEIMHAAGGGIWLVSPDGMWREQHG